MKSSSPIAAFSLVEIVVALAVVTFAVVALIGLLSFGLQNTQDSRERTQAATIAEALCATRRAAPTNDFTASGTYQPGFPLAPLATATNNFVSPSYLTRDGAATNAANADFGFLYSVSPTLNTAPAGTTSGTSTVYFCLYWPAHASPTNAATSHFELTSTFALP
jgi:Tfp pilus assembly protein PilV